MLGQLLAHREPLFHHLGLARLEHGLLEHLTLAIGKWYGSLSLNYLRFYATLVIAPVSVVTLIPVFRFLFW